MLIEIILLYPSIAPPENITRMLSHAENLSINSILTISSASISSLKSHSLILPGHPILHPPIPVVRQLNLPLCPISSFFFFSSSPLFTSTSSLLTSASCLFISTCSLLFFFFLSTLFPASPLLALIRAYRTRLAIINRLISFAGHSSAISFGVK